MASMRMAARRSSSLRASARSSSASSLVMISSARLAIASPEANLAAHVHEPQSHAIRNPRVTIFVGRYKMALTPAEYLTVQKSYGGWSLFGVVVGMALLATPGRGGTGKHSW